jgi:glycosyltransferase involved in cell wall biosynthesis
LNEEQPYVLWLPSWYPNRLAPYDGDFIQRHAKAVAAYLPVHVFYAEKDKEHVVTNDIFVDEKTGDNLTETIIYFSPAGYKINLFQRIASYRKLAGIYNKRIREIFKNRGLPLLQHVHVAYKAGLAARRVRKKYGIPYILTEHWTAFLKEAEPAFSSLSFTAKYMISKIINDAELILPVSDYLTGAMEQRWPNSEYQVVPNVVDTSVFYPVTVKQSVSLQFIHISAMNYQKDPESLFKAMSIVKSRGIPFMLDIFGPVTDQVKKRVEENNISDAVIFHGEVPQTELAPVLQQADALILYSRYETFGCVVIEANACGVPVIAADTPPMRELLQDGFNGIFAKPDNPASLAEAIIRFSSIQRQFNRNEIAAATAACYSYKKIGKMYADVYAKISGF